LGVTSPIGLCLYYKCTDSIGEDFGTLPLSGAYGIDYFIGEESLLGKGLGKKMIAVLLEKIYERADACCVTADTDMNNVASIQTLLSCGFILLDNGKGRYVHWRHQFRTLEDTI